MVGLAEIPDVAVDSAKAGCSSAVLEGVPVLLLLAAQQVGGDQGEAQAIDVGLETQDVEASGLPRLAIGAALGRAHCRPSCQRGS